MIYHIVIYEEHPLSAELVRVGEQLALAETFDEVKSLLDEDLPKHFEGAITAVISRAKPNDQAPILLAWETVGQLKYDLPSDEE